MAQMNRAGYIMTLTRMSCKEKQTISYSNVDDFVNTDDMLVHSADNRFQKRTGILEVDLF